MQQLTINDRATYYIAWILEHPQHTNAQSSGFFFHTLCKYVLKQVQPEAPTSIVFSPPPPQYLAENYD